MPGRGGDDAPRRGLLGRVGRRMRGGITKVRKGVQALQEEARHPGRPPSYQAATSPFWQDEDMRMPEGEGPLTSPASEAGARTGGAPAAPPAPEPAPAEAAETDGEGLPQPEDRTDRDGEPFWFLDGGEDLDGWDQTNPSAEWRERHGVDGPTDG